MSMTFRWMPGDCIVFRGVWRQRIWFTCPVIVVQDNLSLIALYLPAGTPNKIPEKRLTPRQLMSTQQVNLIDRKWVDTDVLMLVVPGAAHSVYAMWEAGHTRFRCWYVNLQEPVRRTAIGFDTMDHLLDIIVSPDRSEWWWKDEDEFREAEAIGMYSAEEARAIRAEGERAINLMKANQSPYCDGWEKWSPPAEWKIPQFPIHWNNIAIQDGSL